MERILMEDFETGFIGGHVCRGLEGLRDFLSQRDGFFDEEHVIEELLERRDVEWEAPSPVSEEFTGKCFHAQRVRDVDGKWRAAAQMVERFAGLNRNAQRLFATPDAGLNR